MYCPKCEQEYRAGFTRCAECGVALVESIARKEKMDVIEEDFAAAMFPDEGEATIFCVNCFNEFAPGAKVCSPCGDMRLAESDRERYMALLDRDPLEQLAVPVKPRNLDKLVLVAKVRTPSDGAFLVQQLEEMGVTAELGTDDSDRFEDPSLVGLYVPPDEKESAEMLMPEDGDVIGDAEDLREDVRGRKMSPDRAYDRLIQRAEGYIGLQKYAFAQKLLGDAVTLVPTRIEAYLVLGRVFAEMGQKKRALEMFREVRSIRGKDDYSDAPLLIAALELRDDKGRPRYRGADAEKAMDELKFYIARHPRSMTALKLLLNAQSARGDKAPGKETTAHMKKINVAYFKDAPRHMSAARAIES